MAAQNEQLVTINTPFIELDKLLKREALTASGGEAPYLISQGMVEVNGQVETRKRKNGTECILCYECTKVCPTKALH